MIKDAATLAELRVLVGYLGEQAPAWWSSHFFGQSAMAFLTPVFGRSARQAQYQGVLEAARRVHDEHIGIGRTLHLFHMPEHYEQGASTLVADREQAEGLFDHIDSPEHAQARLEKLASPQEAKEGPVVVGDLGESLAMPLATMAGLYLDAFRRGIQTYPYLREAQ
ncbi:BrxE family protein [Ectothiorhodospira variabilis]|uniref:BrxE family protein n=1 Tax=Ectothiorhodospira variabilis TaxID=505694 RepID=UPI001EFBCA48|nr:BrxE family protein [Ectothiorhodospira variabilis]MCG5496113.1 BrxE family protein [Ectothiorhodospira variabilis]